MIDGSGRVKMWAALEVRDDGDPDLLLLALDDYQATAVEERDDDPGRGETGRQVRVFFANADHRDQALAGLPSHYRAQAVDVPDEDWARRSQQQLAPIKVGRITVFPTLELLHESTLNPAPPPAGEPIALLIQASMGFGTGHHATTRLCLAALQSIDLSDRSVLDVGTGSGVLALASWRLGAAGVIGIDYDPDAIQSADENRVLNHAADRVQFEVADFRSRGQRPADVVIANLTGAVLTQGSRDLLRLVLPGGMLIVSGVQVHERGEVFAALASASLVWESEEDGWIGAAFTRQDSSEA